MFSSETKTDMYYRNILMFNSHSLFPHSLFPISLYISGSQPRYTFSRGALEISRDKNIIQIALVYFSGHWENSFML
jgi:hypothetical protein